MLGVKTIGICVAAARSCSRSSAERPVVPITIATFIACAARTAASVAAGTEKSIQTSVLFGGRPGGDRHAPAHAGDDHARVLAERGMPLALDRRRQQRARRGADRADDRAAHFSRGAEDADSRVAHDCARVLVELEEPQRRQLLAQLLAQAGGHAGRAAGAPRRSMRPIIASAALTGTGFGSTNSPSPSGSRR